MSDIPQHVLDAAAQAVHDVEHPPPHTCTGEPQEQHLRWATAALEAAEREWPHSPPGRDPASVTSCGTERRWQPITRNPDRPPPLNTPGTPYTRNGERPFGFGPPEVRA